MTMANVYRGPGPECTRAEKLARTICELVREWDQAEPVNDGKGCTSKLIFDTELVARMIQELVDETIAEAEKA